MVSNYTVFPPIPDTSMGAQLDTQSVDHSPIIQAFHLSSKLLFKRMINPLLSSDWIFQRTQLWRDLDEQLQVIHSQMESVIEKRAKELLDMGEPAGRAHNLLDTLLLAKFEGQSLSRREIRDEINTFVFAVGFPVTTNYSFLYSMQFRSGYHHGRHVVCAICSSEISRNANASAKGAAGCGVG